MKALQKYIFSFFILLTMDMVPQGSLSATSDSPPAWSPGGLVNVRYYFIPDIEVYYDLQSADFIYFNGRKWVYSDALPVKYAYYNLYTGYKVPLTDYYGPKPYVFYKTHKLKYPKGYKGPPPRARQLNNRFRNAKPKTGTKPQIQQGNVAHLKNNSDTKH